MSADKSEDIAGNAHAEGSQPKKVRRRAGPFKRSRTGCGTCKRRGKKCDEEWSEEGFCQRCIMGQFECSGRTEQAGGGGAKNGSSAREAYGERSSSGSREPNDSQEPPAVPLEMPSIPDPMPPIPTIPDFQTNAASSSSSMAGPSNPILQNQLSNLDAGLGLPNTFGFWGTPTPLPPNTAQLNHNNLTIDHTNFFPALNNNPQPLYNWPGQFATQPSAFLTTNNDGSLAIDSQPFVWDDQSTSDIWNDFAASFTNTDNTNLKQNHNHQLNANSRVLFLNTEKPTRQGVSLAEIYARVVESWLVGIPSTTRDYARARILALNDSNSVMRNVRFAVSAAYIFLFAGCSERSHENPGNPQPKLVELACKGAGFIDGKSTTLSLSEGGSDAISPLSKDGDNDQLTSALRKIRIYVDHVSTPFAADMESLKWTEDAVRELREIEVTDKSQLSDLLWGVIDLQLVEFIRGGAAPSYNMLALGDKLVRSAMGSNYPSITLARLRTSDTFSLRLYALSDISRCIVQRGRKTIFNFWSDINDSQSEAPAQSDDEEPWATYLGLPDSIVILLAEVVNLCAELSNQPASSIKAQADELERALKSWQSQTFSTVHSIDSTALISRTIAGELWRLAALVLLYQSVHRVGGLHPILRRAQKEILNLLDSIAKLPNGDLWGFIALPAFLAACLSISDNDRQRSMLHLAKPGPERVWLDNIALVERIWEETDETGKLPDWHDKMTREGMSVAFF
ncbi:uncharacterized protein I303_101951 [Kwoniella dejecticola CBS 10117]|uniref:Zn(2)-C6 fungal-type domain-containing protein n=1 Tax=Kwoniella dejecticola CBS 10117 TaxID=1296121 RepID=A0A1A6ACC4_9TREE|nr:uncharacterized protein I303_01913 [Kwoniella dejecticola CBS 10117]OBR87704.1 hypothetical protein I303_01913 [Kwoniella dejecticola CBS 10117]